MACFTWSFFMACSHDMNQVRPYSPPVLLLGSPNRNNRSKPHVINQLVELTTSCMSFKASIRAGATAALADSTTVSLNKAASCARMCGRSCSMAGGINIAKFRGGVEEKIASKRSRCVAVSSLACSGTLISSHVLPFCSCFKISGCALTTEMRLLQNVACPRRDRIPCNRNRAKVCCGSALTAVSKLTSAAAISSRSYCKDPKL
mmetsp:Transcript_58954/g.140750  ORF Transcript_58954/g.140750 Transcript_58954/m.140750 type:complete len:204 (+) Transcript_58954:544-1155(+)